MVQEIKPNQIRKDCFKYGTKIVHLRISHLTHMNREITAARFTNSRTLIFLPAV